MKQQSYYYNNAEPRTVDLHISEDVSGFVIRVWLDDCDVDVPVDVHNALVDAVDEIARAYTTGWCGMGQYLIGSMRGGCFHDKNTMGNVLGVFFSSEGGGRKPTVEQQRKIDQARQDARDLLIGFAKQFDVKLIIDRWIEEDDDPLDDSEFAAAWISFADALEGFGVEVII